VGPARGERRLAGRSHPAGRPQLGDLGDIDRAPDSPLPVRREADDPAVARDAAPDAVDPADAQRLLDDLGPGHGRLAGRLLPGPDEELVGGPVVRIEPGAQLGRRLEEDRVGRGHDERQSRPASWAASAPWSGASPVSSRRRLIRSSVAGWVEKSPDARSSNFLIGFVKYMCWVARLATSSTSWSLEILARARSIPYGLRVSWTDDASARYSRWRLTASWTRRAAIGARIERTIATTNMIAWSPPLPPLSRSLDERRPPPQNVNRRKKSARRAIEPTRTPTMSANRMSKFRTWESSWPMTPWSSSRSSFSRRPVVIATEACFGSRPVA